MRQRNVVVGLVMLLIACWIVYSGVLSALHERIPNRASTMMISSRQNYNAPSIEPKPSTAVMSDVSVQQNTPVRTSSMSEAAAKKGSIKWGSLKAYFDSAPFHIPFAIGSTSTIFTASNTISLIYDYPAALAERYRNKPLDSIGCGDIEEADKVVFTEIDLLEETTGQLFDFSPWGMPIGAGRHHVSLDIGIILKNGEFMYDRAHQSPESFRLIILTRKPNLSGCSKPSEGGGDTIERGLLGNLSTTSIVGMGFSEPFILR